MKKVFGYKHVQARILLKTLDDQYIIGAHRIEHSRSGLSTFGGGVEMAKDKPKINDEDGVEVVKTDKPKIKDALNLNELLDALPTDTNDSSNGDNVDLKASDAGAGGDGGGEKNVLTYEKQLFSNCAQREVNEESGGSVSISPESLSFAFEKGHFVEFLLDLSSKSPKRCIHFLISVDCEAARLVKCINRGINAIKDKIEIRSACALSQEMIHKYEGVELKGKDDGRILTQVKLDQEGRDHLGTAAAMPTITDVTYYAMAPLYQVGRELTKMSSEERNKKFYPLKCQWSIDDKSVEIL
jgi:hypothetical protein